MLGGGGFGRGSCLRPEKVHASYGRDAADGRREAGPERSVAASLRAGHDQGRSNQKGEPNIAQLFTPWGKANAVEEFDYTAFCLPLGYTRSINSPMPIEMEQRPGRIVMLYEMNNTFHMIYTDGRPHPKDLEPTWFGHSIGKWDGDTLVVDTIGFNEQTRIDTEGHPHTDALHVTERFTRTDLGHMAYEMTIDDPKAYTHPWKNTRTFMLRPDWELLEYSCNENNKEVMEGHLKPPVKK